MLHWDDNTSEKYESSLEFSDTPDYLQEKAVMMISKKTNEPNKDKDGKQPGSGEDLSHLTPWQQANLEYKRQKGEDTGWSPTIIEGKTEPDETDDPEPTEETAELGTRPDSGTAESFADRLPKVKYQRNTLLYRRMAIIILLLSIPLAGVIYYVSPLAKLAGVTVTGTQKVSAATVAKEADFTADNDIWPQFIKRNQHLAAVKQAEPRVKSVSVAIKDFNHFVIDVKEYQEVAVLAHNNLYSPILENGVVLTENMKNPTEKMPILENFKDQQLILQVLKAYQGLSQQLQEAVSQIKYAPTAGNQELLQLFMNDGNQVIVNISNLADQMKYYSQVAKDMEKKGIIDMEVGIFSYPYGNEKTVDSTAETTGSSEEEPLAEPQSQQ